ncbi:MAG: hypothetical protein ACRCT1_06465 [Microcoleaceae cyanobacterium]
MIDKLETLGNELIALFWWCVRVYLIFGSAIGNAVGAGSPTIFEENRQVKSTRPIPRI